MRLVLLVQPENDQARIAGRRVRAYVGEAAIERDERPALRLKHLGDALIDGADQSLLMHRVGVMAGRTQQVRDLLRQVLVHLEAHAGQAGRGKTRSRARSAA